MEINKETEKNPFIQDTKKGKLRCALMLSRSHALVLSTSHALTLSTSHPLTLSTSQHLTLSTSQALSLTATLCYCRYYHSNSLVNYGAFPQTWEDADHVDPNLNLKGDNDPLDVLEIGSTPCVSGDVYPVKVLGVLGMVDGGEMDWKIVTVAVSDSMASRVNGARHMNGCQRAGRYLVCCLLASTIFWGGLLLWQLLPRTVPPPPLQPSPHRTSCVPLLATARHRLQQRRCRPRRTGVSGRCSRVVP